MVVRIAPSGGRTRRKGGAVSLAGADVPVVTPARDPGLNVPLIPISGGEVGSVVGRGLQSLGNVLDQGADLVSQMVQRDEGLARGADETSYSDTLQDTIRDLQATADLSDSALVEAAGEKMFQEKQRILSEHKGGQMSGRLLGDRLTKMHNRFADTLAVLNINAADVRLNGQINGKISGIVQNVLSDPDVLVSEDPLEAFRFHVGQLEEEIDFLELRPDQARMVRQVGRSEIALSMITPLIRNATPEMFERAKVLLRSDEFAKILSPGQHRDAIQRVIDAERTLAEVKSEGQKNIDSARALFPNASEETILEKARELTGFADANNVQFFPGPYGRLIAVNKDTFDTTEVIAGSTAEERAADEQKMVEARIAGKLKFVQKMADMAGIELFTKGATTSADGKEGISKTTKPTSTEEGEKTPDLKALVEPIPIEAVEAPYGDKPEDKLSEDEQAVFNHLALARMYLLMDEPTSANAHRGMASHIIENSEDIQARKTMSRVITNPESIAFLGIEVGESLDALQGTVLESPSEREAAKQRAKIIDFATASEFGVGPNTTQGEFAAIIRDRQIRKDEGDEGAGRTLARSDEERSRRRAIGTAAGKDQVKADEQLSFVSEAQGQIENLLVQLQGDPNIPGDEGDPTLVGAIGAVRGAGRSVFTLIDDLGMNDFIRTVNELVFDAEPDSETGETGLEFTMSFFDNPTLSSLDIIEYSIGVIIARLSTPAGRIPVELIKRSIKLVGLKGMRGSQVIIDRLNFVNDRMLQPRVDSITERFPELRKPEEQETFEDEGIPQTFEEQIIPPDIPRFRFEGGKLVPIVPDEAPGGGSAEIPFSPTDEGSSFPRLTGEIVGKTREGRPILLDEEGGFSTERTITEKIGGKWINLPTIFDGKEVSPQEAVEIIESNKGVDPDTDKKLETFKTREQAEEAAIQRSESLDEDLRREGLLPADSSEETFGSEGVEELRGEASNVALETILVPNASGESTVDETVAAVDQLFGHGEFLKRVAKVESNFGEAEGTFRESGDRGIWQLNQKTGFERTKDVKSHPSLEKAYAKIREEFGIDWNEVTFKDLEKPLISALAARLFLLTIPEKIPGSLEGQAKYWKKHYNTVKGKGTIKGFIKDNSTETEG